MQEDCLVKTNIHLIGLFLYNIAPKQYFWGKGYSIIDDFIRKSLGNKQNRKYLQHLLMNTKVRKQLIKHGNLFYGLLKRREKNLIKCLWKLEKDNLMNYRDNDGNDVMLFLCGVRGKTERIIEYVVENGAKIDRKNNKNETVIDRAICIKKHQLAKWLQFLFSEIQQ